MADIFKFIHKHLLVYTPIGWTALQENYDKMPIILSGEVSLRRCGFGKLPHKSAFFHYKFELKEQSCSKIYGNEKKSPQLLSLRENSLRITHQSPTLAHAKRSY